MRAENDKPRVLMVGPDRNVHGGISAMINTYYEAGLDNRTHLKYIGTMKEGSRGKKLFIAVAAYLRFLFSLEKFDIVHINASSDNSFMRKSFFIRAAKRHNKKIVLHQHGGDFQNYYENQISQKRRDYINETLDMADIILVLTDSWKEYFGKLTDKGKIIVMPNGIITNGTADIFDGEHSLDKVLFLGRICSEKGMDELLEAIDRIHTKRSSVNLFVGGIFEDQSYESELKKRSGYVKYLGWISGKEKQKYLSECGIMAIPSHFEGFGLAVIEAMCAGMIPVGSRVGGIPEIIQDGMNGVLVEPRNSASLQEGIEKVISGEVNITAMKDNARQTVLEKYSIEKCVDNIVYVYKKLI